MIISFSQHSESKIDFVHRLKAEEIDLDDETARVIGEVELVGTAQRSSEIARVKGNVQGNLEIACSRCLQPSQFELNALFEVEFVTPENYGADSHETELNAADLSLSVYDGEQIDLNEIIREQLLLNIPMQRLCRENCAGLCQKCGSNRNTDSCDCHPAETNSRWSALKDLISKN